MAPKDKNVLMCLSQPHFLKEKEGSVTVSNFVSTFEQKVVVGQWHLVVCFWRAFRPSEERVSQQFSVHVLILFLGPFHESSK